MTQRVCNLEPVQNDRPQIKGGLRSVQLIIRDLINYQPLTVQRLDTYRSVLIVRLLVSSTVQYGESLTAGRLDWSEMNFIDQTNKYPLYPLWCLPDVIL